MKREYNVEHCFMVWQYILIIVLSVPPFFLLVHSISTGNIKEGEYAYIHTNVIEPLWGFSGPMKPIIETNLTGLRIPTGRRQLLCTNAVEELNQELPQTNPGGGQSGT